MDDSRIVQVSRQLLQSLTPGDLDHTLDRITAAAVETLPGVHYASITVRHEDGRLETAAPTDDMLLGLDAAQYELREGPCYEAATDAAHVVSPNLAADSRFPRYAATAVAAGVKAQVGLRLFDAPRSQGALNLYSRNVGSFQDLGELGALFTHQAAVALNYAREVDSLREAIATRQTIGQAVGIVMERYSLNDQRAFAFLARLSQTRNVKLRQVAEELLSSEEPGDEGQTP